MIIIKILAAIMSFNLESTSLKNNEEIPREFTCKGANKSPHLKWKGGPEKTKSYAIILRDPDAPGGTFIHWVIWNIPAKVNELQAGIEHQAILESGAAQGVNSFNRVGYDGPCPPPGPKHRYIFTLYALDETLELKPKSTAEDLEDQIKGHILSKTTFQGLFGV